MRGIGYTPTLPTGLCKFEHVCVHTSFHELHFKITTHELDLSPKHYATKNQPDLSNSCQAAKH